MRSANRVLVHALFDRVQNPFYVDDRDRKEKEEEEEEGILISISLIRNSKDTARGRGDERVKERKDGEDGRGEGEDERGSELKE